MDPSTPSTSAASPAASLDRIGEDWSCESALIENFKKKSLKSLEYFDLTFLPLIAVLSRKQSSLVLLVDGSAYFPQDKLNEKDQKPIVVKLFASKVPSIDKAKTLEQFEALRSEADLDRPDRLFHRELVLLSRCQTTGSGVVTLLGWGIAENYQGVIVEALGGPNLLDFLVRGVDVPGASKKSQPIVAPPPHLQLLYRLHWAYQLARIVKNVHKRGIIHRDVRSENFAFRTPPTETTFGQVVLFDFDGATYQRRHERGVQPIVQRDATLIESPSQGYFAESLLESFEVDGARPCLHWPESPPSAGPNPGSYTEAPELTYCQGSSRCPQGCRAERLQERAAIRNQSKSFGSAPASLDPESHDDVCACPLCECHEARVDIWHLGTLLAQLFSAHDYGAPGAGRVFTCANCHKRVPWKLTSWDEWCESVEGMIDLATFEVLNFSVVPASLPVKWHGRPIFAKSTMQLQDEVDAHHNQEVPKGVATRLFASRWEWTIISESVRRRLSDLLHSMTSLNADERPSARAVAEALKSMFLGVYDFLAHSHLPVPFMRDAAF